VVPSNKRGVISAGVSLEGAELRLGWKVRSGITLSGYGARSWDGKSVAGLKGEWVW